MGNPMVRFLNWLRGDEGVQRVCPSILRERKRYRFYHKGTPWKANVHRKINTSVPEDNGFNMAGISINELVLEQILSYLDPQAILISNKVCRAWKDEIVRRSFWKCIYARHGLNWSLISNHVKQHDNAWIVFYSNWKYKFLSENLIKNPSGQRHDSLSGWTMIMSEGDGWSYEETPIGCDPLPEDPLFKNSTGCFATSFRWCVKEYKIDLWEMGITPKVMLTSVPFELDCSEMYCSRSDCNAKYTWHIRAESCDGTVLNIHEENRIVVAGSSWETMTYKITFHADDGLLIEDFRYLIIQHSGTDSLFWRGHYGTKMARSSVRLKLLEVE